MKNFLFVIIFGCTISSSLAWPWTKKVSEPKLQTNSIVASTNTKKSSTSALQEAKGVIKDLNLNLTEAKKENSNLKSKLATATVNLQSAESKVLEVQKQANALKEWGIVQQAEAQKYFEKYTSAVKRYHRLKLIAAIIAAAGGVLLGLQFMNLAPPPYNLGVPVGSAALFAALVWFLL